MIKRRNIFLTSLLFILVLFCTGINIHSGAEAKHYNSGVSANTDNIENSLTPGVGLSDEDQMEQSHIYGLSELPECQQPELTSLPFVNSLFISIWQPPKIS